MVGGLIVLEAGCSSRQRVVLWHRSQNPLRPFVPTSSEYVVRGALGPAAMRKLPVFLCGYKDAAAALPEDWA